MGIINRCQQAFNFSSGCCPKTLSAILQRVWIIGIQNLLAQSTLCKILRLQGCGCFLDFEVPVLSFFFSLAGATIARACSNRSKYGEQKAVSIHSFSSTAQSDDVGLSRDYAFFFLPSAG